jgi:hypothetical protein
MRDRRRGEAARSDSHPDSIPICQSDFHHNNTVLFSEEDSGEVDGATNYRAKLAISQSKEAATRSRYICAIKLRESEKLPARSAGNPGRREPRAAT